MSTDGGMNVGRVTVKITVSNNEDRALASRGMLEPEKVAHFELDAVADTGSTQLVLPADVAERLRLPSAGEATIRYADRRSAVRPLVGEVHLELMGREGTFRALLEPDRTSALLGAIVLEDLDFLVDCTGQRLIPRDPVRPTYEVE